MVACLLLLSLLFCADVFAFGPSTSRRLACCTPAYLRKRNGNVSFRPSLHRHSAKDDFEKSFPLDLFRGNDKDKKRSAQAYIQSRLPMVDETGSTLLTGLANGVAKSSLQQGVVPILVPSNDDMPFNAQISRNTLFVRPFYADLIKLIGACHTVILMGSAGTGKSMFQNILLHYMLTSHKDASVKPSGHPFAHLDGRVCGVVPSVVIRQIGRDVEIYNLQTQEAFECPCNLITLRQFNPATTVYFYEPLNIKEEPLQVPGLPSIITVSPDSTRYKEFAKSGARVLVMPRYSLNELRSIGKYMLEDSDHKNVAAVKELFDDASIIARYRRHGGIIRRVLVSDLGKRMEYEIQQNLSIRGTNYWKCSNLNDPDDISEGASYVVELSAPLTPTSCNTHPAELDSDPTSEGFDATQWTFDFHEREAHPSSDTVRQDLANKSDALSLADMQRSLIHNEGARLLFPHLFEQYAFRAVMELFGVSGLERGRPPTLGAAAEGICYVPPVRTLPAFDAYFKKGSTLYLIQVSTTKENKLCSNGAVANTLNMLGLTAEQARCIHLIYVRKHRSSEWTPTIYNYTTPTTEEYKALMDAPWLRELQRFKDAFIVTTVDFDGNWRPLVNGTLVEIAVLTNPVKMWGEDAKKAMNEQLWTDCSNCARKR